MTTAISKIEERQRWYHQLELEWHQTLNSGMSFRQIPLMSDKSYMWKCQTCGFEYQKSMRTRWTNRSKCPYCVAKVRSAKLRLATFEKSLGYCRPFLMRDWHPTRNGDLNAFELYPHTNTVIWWQCHRCGYEWSSTAAQRLKLKHRCRCCVERMRLNDNNVVLKCPQLLVEWDICKNQYRPTELTIGSGKSVFWICSKCGHRWESRLSSRTRKGTGCPNCFRLRQKQRWLNKTSTSS